MSSPATSPQPSPTCGSPPPSPGTRGHLPQPGGAECTARVLEHLPGGTLHGSGYLASAVVTELGRMVGRVSRALREVDHPGLGRTLQGDLQHAARALDVLTDHLTDPVDRARVEQVRHEAWPLVENANLPVQAVHGDLTDDNLVCRDVDGLRIPDGVIDFGHVVRTWAVGELAITISSLLHHEGMTPVGALRAAVAFHQVRSLSEAEADAQWPLVALRGAVLVASGYQQTGLDGDANQYEISGLEQERRILAAAVAVPLPVMQHVTRLALGLPTEPAVLPAHGLLARLGDVTVLDLSAESDDLDGGRWLEPGIEYALAATADTAVASAFEHRATRAVPLSGTAPATVPTGLDLWTRTPIELTAPWAGRLERDGDAVVLVGATHLLRIESTDLATGSEVAAGQPLCVVRARSRVRITVTTTPDVVPAFVTPELAAPWRGVVCDPAPLLGLDPTDDDPHPRAHELQARRRTSLAEVQEHYYAAPPQIERGWREHLLATDGRSYLDMVNNVATLGHGHPGYADAVSRQLRRFNSNSRFHYEAVVEFSELTKESADFFVDALDHALTTGA